MFAAANGAVLQAGTSNTARAAAALRQCPRRVRPRPAVKPPRSNWVRPRAGRSVRADHERGCPADISGREDARQPVRAKVRHDHPEAAAIRAARPNSIEFMTASEKQSVEQNHSPALTDFVKVSLDAVRCFPVMDLRFAHPGESAPSRRPICRPASGIAVLHTSSRLIGVEPRAVHALCTKRFRRQRRLIVERGDRQIHVRRRP